MLDRVFTVVLALATIYAGLFGIALATGDPEPAVTALRGLLGALAVIVMLIVLTVYSPFVIAVVRGLWPEFREEPERLYCGWGWVFLSRRGLDRRWAYRAVRNAHPLPPTGLYTSFGADGRRVFEALGRAATSKGDKYRITGWLTEIQEADLDGYDRFLGYLEVASIDASIYAARENMPIDYAKVLLP